MSSVYVISDLRLAHRKIVEFTANSPGAFRGGSTVDEHDEWVIGQMLAVRPNKRTLWWILGDVGFDEEKLGMLDSVPGRKRLLLGNHDLFDTSVYMKHFEWVGGTIKKYGMWFSHVPMHPHELRGFPNVHGHCHYGPIMAPGYGDKPDPRYLNMAIDWAPDHSPVTLDWLRTHFGIAPSDGTSYYDED